MSPLHRKLSAALLALSPLAACNSGSFSSVTALDNATHDVNFPIAAGPHALDCNVCHGGFDTFREFSCIGCHDHAEEVTAPVHAGIDDYTYDRRSCFGCHPRGEALSFEYHARFFPIAPGTPHEAQTCDECHDVPGDRSKYTCTNCHTHEEAATAAQHTSVAEYEWSSPACYRCHPDGNGLPRESHTFYFPIAGEVSHRDAQCVECHPVAGQRTVVECINCHAHPSGESASQHRPVGGYEYRSELCLRCHFDSSVPRVSEHRPFRIDGGPHRPDRAACLRCHTSSRSDRAWAADFVPFDCTPCHDCGRMDREHRRRNGYACVSATCVSSGCHPTGEGD